MAPLGNGTKRMARVDDRKYRILRKAILQRDGFICWLCGNRGADTVDHVTPRCKGGTNDPHNLRAAHGKCNSGRRERPPAFAVNSRSW